MTIAAILAEKGREVFSVECTTSLRDCVQLLATNRIGSVPVTKDGKVVGIMSERDLVYGLAESGAAILDSKVEQVMTAPAITVTSQVSVLAALSMMSKRRIRHLPVLEEGRLIGIVSIGDLVKFRIDRIQQEAEAMREYIQSA